MSIVLTHQDDTPLTGITLIAERAIDSDAIGLKILNDGDQDVDGLFLVLYAENDPGSGLYQSVGHPVTDELMGRFQITGQNSDATPGQQIILGVTQPMGHLAVAMLPTIKAGDWIEADFWLSQSGSSAGGGAVNIKIEVANQAQAYPLPFGPSQVAWGVDSGQKQPRSYFINARSVTATGSPDDYVHAAAGSWLLEGEEYDDAGIQDVQFDQLDGDAVALLTGEVYIAALTQSGTDAPTVTKGSKDVAASAVYPTPPAGELLLAFVTVPYNAGTTVITSGEIEDQRVFGRYKVAAPPTGLSVTVHPGEAIIANFRQVRTLAASVSLNPSATNRVWLEWNGDVTVTTSDTPPSAGAIKLATVTTDPSNVTVNTDNRTYISAVTGGAVTAFSAQYLVLGRISSGAGPGEELDGGDLNTIVGRQALTITGGDLTVGRAEHGIIQADFYNSDDTDNTSKYLMRIRTAAAADAALQFAWSESAGEVDWTVGADSAASTPGNFVLSCGTTLSARRVLEVDADSNVKGGHTHGGTWEIRTTTEEVTWSGTGAIDTTANLLPANSLLLGVEVRNTSALTNVTDYEVGDNSGSAAARFASSAAVNGSSGTTFVCPNIWNGALATTLALSPWNTSAAKVRLTRTTGAGTQSGTTRIVVTALVFTPPTS